MKTVLVTGGNRGIGRAIVLELARCGYRVAVNYHRREAEARDTIAAVETAGGSAYLLPFDVSDREQCRSVLEHDLKDKEVYWGVVCNAGIAADASFPMMRGEMWDRVIRTNLDAFYNTLHPVVMPMVQARRGGRIVTISSISGLAGNRGQTNYAAAKAGIIGASRSLAQEVAKRHITVNSVAPGLITTEMTDGLPREEIIRNIPMRRFGKPEEVAALVGFLVSEAAGYITGQVISINGGML